jgi:hypothetical protein
MSRLGILFRSRITLALLGMALVGGAGAYWAVTSSAHPTPQASSSLNQDPTSSASVDNPAGTATTDPGAAATATTIRNTPTPRPTATPCPATPTPVPVGQSGQWQGRVASKGTSTFALRVGCARLTVAVDTNTTWTGTGIGAVTSFAALRTGASAVVNATSQGGGTYLAASINAHNDT